jgi:stage II sporulation protein R
VKNSSLLYIAGIVLFVIYFFVVVLGYDPLQPSIASKVLRFHVLANSDAACDQAVKEEVRDAVGIYLQPLLKEADNLEETKRIVDENLEEIIATARDTLEKNGYDYKVTAQVARIDFPEKTYGAFSFPKGEYEALQIVIGEGKGQNWWCVLYPNMCFKGTVFEVVEEDAEEALREVLSPWEYADVFDSGKVEFRFKFLEYFTERG